MQAFHGKPEIKKQYLARIRAHRAADELVQGVYWENGKGCAIGCLAETAVCPHEVLEAQIAVPMSLLFLVDRLFEGMSAAKAQEWPEAFLTAVEPGDETLPRKLDQWLIWLLVDEQEGVVRLARSEAGKTAIRHRS